jgi:predicted AlkP superfamily pyrophosphatase or phosphodiesterase
MLDGTRPDVLRRTNVPTIQRLSKDGVVYLRARAGYPSQTRVSFVTLPTGAYAGSHGIVGGDNFKDEAWQTVTLGDAHDPIPSQSLNLRPTMFEDTTAAGLTSLYAAMKGYELVGARGATWTINGNRTLDQTAFATRYAPEVHGSRSLALHDKQRLSREMLAQTLALVRERRPNLSVVNLGSADYAGHSFGPDSREYRESLEFLDGLIAELLKALDDLGIRERATIVISSDHGFTDSGPSPQVAVEWRGADARLPGLVRRGIEHHVTDTGGSSMGVYLRDKTRTVEAVSVLREEAWVESIYCETAAARCDRSLTELRAYYPGRSPDLTVDLDDDAALRPMRVGNHGSLREQDVSIPLIFSGAGVAKGRTLGEGGLVDVAPTVLRLLGVPARHLRPDGRVLEEALLVREGKTTAERR